MTTYKAANGQEITEEMIARWNESYDRGEFPAGERTVGTVVNGRPPLSSDKTVTIAVKVPLGMKKALIAKAERNGMTMSEYARSVFADDLMTA